MNSEIKNCSDKKSHSKSDTNITIDINMNTKKNNDNDKLDKPSISIPYTISVIKPDQETQIPDPIDFMSILYSNDRSKSSKTVNQQYLPNKLKKEVTDDEIDQIYANMQLIKIERKKQKYISLQHKDSKSFENKINNNSSINESLVNESSSDKGNIKDSTDNK